MKSLYLHLLLCSLFCFTSCHRPETLVLYTSQDQFYAEPLLAGFTAATGIRVLPVFDSESVKTFGLVQRLRAEKSNPRCDLFWSNEEIMAGLLAQENVVSSLTHFGYRTRRLVINTNFLSIADAPRVLQELTDAKWKGKIALASPLFGTTFHHFLLLRTTWGDAKWQSWCEELRSNNAFILDGNSLVVKLVGQGEAWIGLTDWDDIDSGQKRNLPIATLPLTIELPYIRNSLAIVKGAPNPRNALRFMEWIAAPPQVDTLINSGALEGRHAPATNSPVLQLSTDLEQTRKLLSQIFSR
ncbi:MAG: extracellular solute-binding protein [Verrucomicrobiota bacterium]|nr:extracellular solute-binding protein [Verrucomicrobiota bacterium]